MTLQVIGAGFGRTGTESMKLALEQLGLGPCHHMKEVLPDSAQSATWRAIAGGATPDWEAAFAGFNSAVDWPSAYFWRELSEVYPRAKVILTLRSAESWYASFSNTIARVLAARKDPGAIGSRLVGERVFGGRYTERDHAIAVFEQNTRDVQAAFGEDRLLTYRIGDGWEPLCAFLEKPVPDQPFPRSNSAADFAAFLEDLGAAD
ncbi:MAG: sulfotransferase family protein [Gammaproteobacteria bacterium]|nr:sulfotransferase family protein [Gammaproteobacteria bacterium]NNM00521.1 sulfotransferase family protein [Gammaproteobacteria bacterium]